MPFSNPVVGGGGALVRTAIHSPNYAAGTTGWSINRDGTAEFNTLGGTLQISSAGIFFYVPDAGIGNLRASITTADGTDPYGNTYHGGLFVNQQQVWATGNGSHTIVLNQTGQTGPEIQFIPGGFNALYHFLMDQAGGRLLAEPLNASGAKLEVGNDLQVNTAIYAKDPNAIFQETWHTVILVNGWANKGGSAQVAKYRKLASPANSVQIVADITGGTTTNSTTLFQLPAGYRPSVISPATPIYTSGRAANNDPPVIFLDTAGNVKLFNCASATELQINAIFSLDS